MKFPQTANPKTVKDVAIPGKILGHQSPNTNWLAPVAIMDPHSGVGGRTPAPTKLRPAVRRIANPIVIENWTSDGAN